MIDTLMTNLAQIDRGEFTPSESIRAFCDGRRYAVLTLHRPSNVDRKETLEPIWGALSEISRSIPILFPVHPRTRAKIEAFGLNGAGITMIDPIGSMDMLVFGAGRRTWSSPIPGDCRRRRRSWACPASPSGRTRNGR